MTALRRVISHLTVLGVLCVALCGCAVTSHQDNGCGRTAQENRAIVLSFYRVGLLEKQPRKAFSSYVSPAFVEHKPDVEKGTRDATAAFLEALIAELPDSKWEVIRTIAEGELVFLHARFTPAAGAAEYSIGDVFRLENCLIVEHWDMVGPPAQRPVNPNPRF